MAFICFSMVSLVLNDFYWVFHGFHRFLKVVIGFRCFLIISLVFVVWYNRSTQFCWWHPWAFSKVAVQQLMCDKISSFPSFPLLPFPSFPSILSFPPFLLLSYLPPLSFCQFGLAVNQAAATGSGHNGDRLPVLHGARMRKHRGLEPIAGRDGSIDMIGAIWQSDIALHFVQWKKILAPISGHTAGPTCQQIAHWFFWLSALNLKMAARSRR